VLGGSRHHTGAEGLIGYNHHQPMGGYPGY
jgi:hypothetical protein